eukprot:229662-Rhodomonas_salina.1
MRTREAERSVEKFRRFSDITSPPCFYKLLDGIGTRLCSASRGIPGVDNLRNCVQSGSKNLPGYPG